MPPVGFEPTISAGERAQTYALDRAATGTGTIETDRIPKYKHNSGRAVGKQYLHDISRRDSKLVDYVEGDAQQGRRRQDPSHHDGPSRINVLSL